MGVLALVALPMPGLARTAAEGERSPDPASDVTLPRSRTLPPEPVTAPWQSRASASFTHFDVHLQVSPVGWTFDNTGGGYSGLARLGPAILHRGRDAMWVASVAYEISGLSYVAAGAHLFALNTNAHVGGQAGVVLEPSGRLGAAGSICFFAVCLELQRRGFGRSGGSTAAFLLLTVELLSLKDEFTYLRRTE